MLRRRNKKPKSQGRWGGAGSHGLLQVPATSLAVSRPASVSWPSPAAPDPPGRAALAHQTLWLLYNLVPASSQETVVAGGQSSSESLKAGQVRGFRLEGKHTAGLPGVQGLVLCPETGFGGKRLREEGGRGVEGGPISSPISPEA